MRKYIHFFILLFSLLAIAGALAFWGYQTRQPTMNPIGTVGNTGGNLNNCGLFCEYNGTVYFANPADGYSLYTMTVDEQNITKITSSEVCNILAAGDYIYYFQRSSHDDTMGNVRISHGFFRCDLDGSHALTMTTDTVVLAQLVSNDLYFLVSKKSGPVLLKMHIDKTGKEELANYQVNPASARGPIMYYNGTVGNHFLYTYNTATGEINELLQQNVWFPIASGNYVYFLDLESDYRLCRYSIDKGDVEVLTEDRVDCYNVGGDYIYYQSRSSKEPALKMMRTDGSDVTTIAVGNYTNINMTSKYVYFQEYSQPRSLYHSPLGSTGYSSMWSTP